MRARQIGQAKGHEVGQSWARAVDTLTFGPARRRRRMHIRLARLDRADASARAAGVDVLAARSRPGAPAAWRPADDGASGGGRGRQTLVVIGLVALVSVLSVVSGRVPWLRRSDDGGLSVKDATTPPAGVDEQRSRVVPAVAAPVGAGGYRYEQLQTGSADPVAWDPCRAVHFVTYGTAPAGMGSAVAEAVSAVSRASGLQFVDDGPSSEAPTQAQRSTYQPERYGRRWAPVLIAWTDPSTTPDLAGSIIGLGGAVPAGRDDAHLTYVTGKVLLDAPQFASDLGSDPASGPVLAAVVQHELGHVLGLAHVDDPAQVMFPEAQLQVTGLGDGDRRGLAAVGRGRCAPEL